MRRLLAVLFAAALLAPLSPAANAGISSEQKKELNSIRGEVTKIPSLVRKKQIAEAEQTLAEAEAKLDEYVKTEMIADREPALHSLRQLIEKQKTILTRAGGKLKVEEISFTDVVAPILAKNCLGCHGDNPKGGLRLDTFAGMEKGGRTRRCSSSANRN